MPRPSVGDRVRVVGILPDDPDPLPIGLEGTVTSVTPLEWKFQQYGVSWESYSDDLGRRHNRTLSLLVDDPFIILGA